MTYPKESARIYCNQKGEYVMKNIFKKFSKLFLIFFACFSAVMVAYAETAPSKLNMTYYTKSASELPMSFPANFHVKKTTDGKYAFCTYYSKHPPVQSVSYSRGSLITDNGMNYILKKAYSAKDDNSFFIYQNALWIYMIDQGKMPGAYYDLTVFKSRVNSTNSDTANKIKELVQNAKKASANDTTSPTISIDASQAKLALESNGEYYKLSNIKVKASSSSYKLESVKNASTGAKLSGVKYGKDGDSVYIRIPASQVSSVSTSYNYTFTLSKDIYKSYTYTPSDSSYQTMVTTYKTTKKASASSNFTIKKTTSIPVEKVDASSGEAVSGASLQVVSSTGKIIDSWTSTKEAHTVEGLSAGTYVLKEIAAPNGYILSDVQTTFKVDNNGNVTNNNGEKITKITYKNTKTSIIISKQDITSKQELPGAQLVIKDKDGKEVVKWTSSSKKYVIKGLAAGTYTLTETAAPEGYALSSETITFRIDKNGKLYNGDGKSVENIVMYNSPVKSQEVAISKRDITTNQELPRATLTLKDSSGNVVDTWESSTEEHIIKNLKAGTYTLTETKEPDGYILSTESITFKVDSEGKLYDKDGKNISKVIMYNTKKNTPGGVSISKQDITNGKELPGATLVVKDYDGNMIDTWVSTDTPHLIENLKAGIYTLTETIAPSGYVLSTETITFTVKEDGSITKVVMYNSPNSKDVPVENTGSFKTITSTVVGTIIIMIGSAMVFKTCKKKEQ